MLPQPNIVYGSFQNRANWKILINFFFLAVRLNLNLANMSTHDHKAKITWIQWMTVIHSVDGKSHDMQSDYLGFGQNLRFCVITYTLLFTCLHKIQENNSDFKKKSFVVRIHWLIIWSLFRVIGHWWKGH